jgi:hypothetical protein
MKARTFADMGMEQTAQPMWAAAEPLKSNIKLVLAPARSYTGETQGNGTFVGGLRQHSHGSLPFSTYQGPDLTCPCYRPFFRFLTDL